MSLKNHLYFRNIQEGVVEYKQRKGGGPQTNEREEEPDYRPMADVFSNSLRMFDRDITYRHVRRTLDIAVHFDLIEIEFQSCFDQPAFERYYLEKFGIALVHLSCFNRTGLFIIDDRDKFDGFFRFIQIFIDNANFNRNDECDAKIRFIKSFKLYSSEDMIRAVNSYGVLHFSLMNHLLKEKELINPQIEAIKVYLNEQGISYSIVDENLEIYDASVDILNEIVDNFDVIYATCSGSGAILRPTAFNTTPLAPLLENDADDYDLTGTGAFVWRRL